MAETHEAKQPRDIRQEVTDRILSAMGKGNIPWRRPWRDDERPMGSPTNASTGKGYNGGNRLVLMMSQLDQGFSDSRWLTFKQAQTLGGSVEKGQKGTAIEYWDKVPFWKKKGVEYEHQGRPVRLGEWPKTDYPQNVKLGDGREVPTKDVTVLYDGARRTWRQAEKELTTMFCKAHTVFNVGQCKDLQIEPLRVVQDPDFGKAQHIVQGMQNDGVTLKHGGNQAFYSPVSDGVTMPHQEQFLSKEAYIGTLLHELGHATGNEKRNNRQFTGKFGTPDYAREELVAELTSAFVAAETGVGFDDDQHAGYLGSWLKSLGEDKHELFRAAKEATKAADYLIERGREVEMGIDAQKTESAKEVQERGGQKEPASASPDESPEDALRAIWTDQGVSKERQDEMISAITAKAAPGAQIGPFKIPENTPESSPQQKTVRRRRSAAELER